VIIFKQPESHVVTGFQAFLDKVCLKVKKGFQTAGAQ